MKRQMKRQIVIEVNPKYNITNLSKVNEKLEQGWLVKRVVICNDNAIHYLLEKEVPDENKRD